MRPSPTIYQSLLNNIDAFLVILNTDGTLAAINHIAEGFISAEENLGKFIGDLPWWAEPASAVKLWTQACQVANTGTRFYFADDVALHEGITRVNFSVSPLVDDAHNVIFLLAEARGFPPAMADSSQNASLLPTQSQRDWLLDIEDRFRLMVENIDDYAMFMIDLDGFISSWNRGAERLTGYADIEAIGRHFSMLYPKDIMDREHAAHELTMAQVHGRYEEEGVRVRKNGTRYDAQIIVWRIDNHEGETVGYAKITRDITLRKAAERALKDSEAKFRTMTDAMPQMVWSATPDGKQDYINQQWFRFTGAEQSAQAGEGWLDYVHADDIARVRDLWWKSLAQGNDFEAQFRLHHVSGVYRWALGRALPVRDDQQKVIRWMGTLTDIHEQKRAESTLQESARRKDEYLAMLAHELRNPLAPIRNSTQLLRRSKPDEVMMSGLEVIDRQVAHMTRLIDDLLDVARISRGKIELRRENFELGELVRQTSEDFKAGYENKQVTLTLDPPQRPLWLFADPTRIAQALGNLLHNALKFTEAQGRVHISLAEETHNGKAYGVVRVADTGIGIDPHLLEQLFEPFVQGDQDLARSKGGLGLGLALIKGFANLHGGNVHARSAGLGQGAEFVFRLPLATPLPAEMAFEQAEAIAAPLNVVLIDDNRDMVETLAALLRMDGHNVHCAYDGVTGLPLINSVKPNLVLCDIGLPGELDGYAVARAVRDNPDLDQVFMVALSGYGQEKDRKQAFDCGFDDHLLKPIDFKTLTTMIKAAEPGRRQKA